MTFAPMCHPHPRKSPNAICGPIPSRHRVLPGSIALMAALSISAVGAPAQSTFAGQPIGSTSGEQSVEVKSAAGGTVNTGEVLTAGNPAGDFTADGGASDCSGATLPAGGTCTESVTFKPSAPGLRMGRGVRVFVPSMVVPSRNVTVPVGVLPAGALATTAVNVTVAPTVDGLRLEVSVVVEPGSTI